MTEKFQTVTSKVNKPTTYFLIGIMWIAIAIISLGIGTVFEHLYNNINRYLENDPGTFFILVFVLILLILCCIALIKNLTCQKKDKIRKAIIDESGATFYNSQNNIVNTILYSELQQSRNSPDDLRVYITRGRYSKIYLNIYLTNKAGKIVMTNIDFNFEYVILSNQFEMYRQFLRGVQSFRPDLKISSQTIKEYSLTPDFPPVKNHGRFDFIISAFLLLVGLGLIYTLVILIRVFFK